MTANYKNTETSVRRRHLGSSSDKPMLAYMHPIYTNNGHPGDKEQ
jgi:hypothetical protein